MSSADPFVYMWAYRVRPELAQEFRRLYGPEGAWARLFRQAVGYLGTDLYRDRNDRNRYVTVDRWESEEAFKSFRTRFADEYERLDRKAERLTLDETSLGEFGPVAIDGSIPTTHSGSDAAIPGTLLAMADKRVVFDFEISFSNGGGIQGRDFRLDIDGDTISDRDLADLLVADLRLLMVNTVAVSNKRYIDEDHKRAR